MLLTPEQQGEMVFHILYHDYHRPFVKGKANRQKIEDAITVALYRKELPPIQEDDIDCIVKMVDALISSAHI
jgi:hypothetical protein